MEEYELDLRDYLRVLWRGKWIVLATFLVAVAVAAAVSFRAPDIYRAQARLAVRLPLDLFGTATVLTLDAQSAGGAQVGVLQFLTPKLVAEWAKDPAHLASALGEGELDPEWVASHVETQVDGEFLTLSLEGPVEPEKLRRALEGVIAALQARGAQELQAVLTTRREELSRRISAWEAELARAKAQAEFQRDQILARISHLVQEVDMPELPMGDQITLSGYRLQKELDLLYSRLREVELELDRLERLGVAALPGVGENYGDVLGELAALEAKEAAISSLASSPPSPIEVVRGAFASGSPVAPNRKMNLAVAGVLGLFCGVLLAFFWHWLREPEESGAGTKKPDTHRGEAQ